MRFLYDKEALERTHVTRFKFQEFFVEVQVSSSIEVTQDASSIEVMGWGLSESR